ncbi:MAG TPA: M20 aminoacylase family protein [Candidatus Bipolaricaulota bacterium]
MSSTTAAAKSHLSRIDAYHTELTALRRDFHQHPELAFEERRTSKIVAQKLESWGIQVHCGMAKTGVVGTLKVGNSKKTIGLRADMDALPIHEANTFAHRSLHDGVMHACGHDGHTTMLLGAAKYLSEMKNFDGTVYLIFQPAEENGGGGEVMIKDGLFEKFPAQEVYGMHNWPGMDFGKFAMRVGPAMAAVDNFDIEITGKGAHAAKPDAGIDSVLVGAQVVTALQSIVARNVSPLDNAVVSVTQFHGGDAYNVLPERIVLRGCTRSLKAEVRAQLEEAIARVVDGVCRANGATFKFNFMRGYPVTVNHARETAIAQQVTSQLVGEQNVNPEVAPTMGAEDFSYMLEKRPGSYIFAGNGDSAGVHNPHYEFNDELLTLGAKYWALLVETQLAK